MNAKVCERNILRLTNRLALLTFFFCVFSGAMGQTRTVINDLAGLNAMTATGNYIIKADIDATPAQGGTGGYTANISDFSGTLECDVKADGTFYKIIGLTKPLFYSINGGTVKNVMLKDVNINATGSNHAGGIARVLKGTSTNIGCIYNCGVLSGSIGCGTNNNAGGIVGDLGDNDADNSYARVINCFSYATITGGKNVAGIVGYNHYATKSTDIRTMVMNCMFYGDITGGTNVYPVYGGKIIKNLKEDNAVGLNTFNYYAYDKLKTKEIPYNNTDANFLCVLAAEDKYLNRFELYRLLLNSNKKLAAFYATGSADNANQMLKWVLETADRTNANPYPYPILKAQGRYPSIINPDIEHAPDSTAVGPNKGGKLGKTLAVTISNTKTDGGQTWPSGATLKSEIFNQVTQQYEITLTRTDKDFDRFNFNYDKVQLPYYNDVGTGNYTGNRVVTGWKITSITPAASSDYTAANYGPTNNVYPRDYPNFNFADRKSTNKDLYTVSGRVFSQGAYFDVPYGVTSITIEPYWAQAAYIADEYYDVVYKSDYSGKQGVSQTGTQVENNTQFNSQSVKKTMSDALNQLSSSGSVYDNAVVLVGNFHLDGVPSGGAKRFTMMSVDEDNDHEPDYSLIYHHKNRTTVCPIRFDFLNVPGTAQVQKPYGASNILNVTIFKTRGWFEVTNTSLMYSNQVEYENLNLGNNITKEYSPLILLGGVFDQFVSTQKDYDVKGKTIYIHVGGNVWIDQFGLGTHGDGDKATPHVPVSVTGGEFVGFYLTGTYNQNAAITTDNAECYISGGHFIEAAGASQEQINGDVRWQIYNADIDNFYGGGTNDARPIQGDVTVDIFNSRVTTYCGGPKFGNMQANKKVTTNAEGCTFGVFFGAGFGGISYARKKYYDKTTYDFGTLQKYYYCPTNPGSHQNEKGKYYDGYSTNGPGADANSTYGTKGPGVATDFDYEFFVWSSGPTGARFYIKFASFSLAECDKVESKLKRCTILGNFYGGGSLGKVNEIAISELDGCNVLGNVYGAGFSATLPTIEVRDAGFAKDSNGNYLFPKFNKHSGIFQPGKETETTTYTWKQGTFPNEGGSGFDGEQVITDVDLSKTNLGSTKEVKLTLKGNTTVQGHVFGGGDESLVSGNTEVNILEQTKVFGNIYGGGNMGVVEGNTKVIVDGQTSNSGQGTGSNNNSTND